MRGLALARAGVVVLEPNDVVFAQVFAVLHLNQNERNDARIFEAVGGARRHIGGLVSGEQRFAVAAGDFCGAGYDDPVLAPVMVHL